MDSLTNLQNWLTMTRLSSGRQIAYGRASGYQAVTGSQYNSDICHFQIDLKRRIMSIDRMKIERREASTGKAGTDEINGGTYGR